MDNKRYGLLDYVYLSKDNLNLVLEPGDVVHVSEEPDGSHKIFGYKIPSEYKFDWYFKLVEEEE